MLLDNIDNVPSSADEILDSIRMYKRMNSSASQENIISTTRNVVIGLHDFLARQVMYSIRNVMGFFSTVKASDLRLILDKNQVEYIRLTKANYTDIHKAIVPFYPFTKKPFDISAYCNDSFTKFDMNTRIDKLTESYKRLRAYLKANDLESAEASIANIFNMSGADLSDANIKYLTEVVIVRLPRSHMMFGEVFSSMKEMDEAVKSVLRDYKAKLNSTSNISNSISQFRITSRLDSLYKAMDEVTKELYNKKNDGVDIAKLEKLVVASNATASLLESFAMLVKEYMNIDHWMAECIIAGINKNKK